MTDKIIAACDGAAKGNPGPAGWGWVIADAAGNPVQWEAGPLGRATNNVAELTALAELLTALPEVDAVEIRMDSQYAMNAVTKWIGGWRRNGWKTASGKPVANQELVERIDYLLAGLKVTFKHVAAHRADGDVLNAIADQAASDAARTQRPAGTAHGTPQPPLPDPARASRSRSGGTAGGARRTKSRGGAGAVRAQFAGRCSCGQQYKAGELIAKTGTAGWGHAACAA